MNKDIENCFIILTIYIRDVATIEEIERLARAITPLNDAIMQRIGPDEGTTTN